jgi:hypothetical protein
VITNEKWLQYFRKEWHLLGREVALKKIQEVQWRLTEKYKRN